MQLDSLMQSIARLRSRYGETRKFRGIRLAFLLLLCLLLGSGASTREVLVLALSLPSKTKVYKRSRAATGSGGGGGGAGGGPAKPNGFELSVNVAMGAIVLGTFTNVEGKG